MTTEKPLQSNHQPNSNPQSYVLITPARNEAAFIERTLDSVTSQTALPLKWVIVSDGSTDATDRIVTRYAQQYDWIELVQLPPRRERDFAGKVHAFNAGYSVVRSLNYNAIGSLDADISFDPKYFEFLLEQLSKDSGLGLVGTPFEENGKSYDYRFVSIEHVSGACQLFRRECFEAIGGYKPIASGGIDLIAVLSARAKGWQTRTFPEKTCSHHRKVGAAEHTGFKERFHRGRMDYLLGNHPLWEVSRSLYQITNKPYLVGGLLILAGYVWTGSRGYEKTIPRQLMEFRRKDQMARLKRMVGRLLRRPA